MKPIFTVGATFLFLAGIASVTASAQSAPPSAAKSPANSAATKPALPDDADKRAEAYFDFTMGHYFQQEFEANSRSEDANRAIDFFKKAYTLDPHSQQISEELAEMYFQSQRIRDAVTEAQSIISKDPDNLPARRLLARIYVRTLGDLSDTSGQHDTLVRASDQYREILRLDPTDTDAALWLARLYRLQNEHDKAESV